jgi:peroxiredoxin
LGAAAAAVIAAAGWNIRRQLVVRDPYAFDRSRPVAFADVAESNGPVGDAAPGELAFTTPAGKPVDLAAYRGRRNVVLVFTRGDTARAVPGAYAGSICLYCTSQTSRLIANYPRLAAEDAEVVVVFPVAARAGAAAVKRFEAEVRRDARQQDGLSIERPPFPVVLDVGLAATDRLGLREDLAKPATYILDKEGRTRFAYVGRSLADRPSVKSILEQLARINRPGGPAAATP